MATYSTKHDLIPYLDKQFSKTLNDTDVKIRLSNNLWKNQLDNN